MILTIKQEIIKMEEKDVALLKSCIISRKGGVPMEELNEDYKDLVGTSIPVQKFGFKSLETLLNSIPGVKVTNGLVNADSDKSKHIQELIQKQKSAPTKRKFHSSKHQPYKKLRKNAGVYNNRDTHINRYNDVKMNFYNNGPHSNKSSQGLHLIEDYLNELYELSMSIDKEILKYKKMLKNQIDFQNDFNFNSNSFVTGTPRDNYYFMDYQLIGDDFMIDLAVRNGLQSSVRPRTCRSGLTLKRAISLVQQKGCSKKVLIALGAIDILEGTTLDQMIDNTVDLLFEVVQQGATPVLCTIPPLPNLRSSQAIVTLNRYNGWLYSANLPMVNLNEIFKENRFIKMNYFEGNAEQKSWHSLVYWSRRGQSAVEAELKRQLSR